MSVSREAVTGSGIRLPTQNGGTAKEPLTRFRQPPPWAVSLTYPDGTPLLCAQQAQPCRFTINIG